MAIAEGACGAWRGRRGTIRAARIVVATLTTACALAVGPTCPSGTAVALGAVPRSHAMRAIDAERWTMPIAGAASSAAAAVAAAADPGAGAAADDGSAGRGSGADGADGASASSASSASPRWRWPVRPPHTITRPFSPPATAYGPGHRGVDIAADPGADVLAPADGTVSFAGVVVDRPVVSIRHADGLVSSVEPVVPTVSAGERVSAGQVIGTVAAAPRHEPDGGVHLGARLHGEYVDPALLLASLRHAVLLPLNP